MNYTIFGHVGKKAVLKGNNLSYPAICRALALLFEYRTTDCNISCSFSTNGKEGQPDNIIEWIPSIEFGNEHELPHRFTTDANDLLIHKEYFTGEDDISYSLTDTIEKDITDYNEPNGSPYEGR